MLPQLTQTVPSPLTASPALTVAIYRFRLRTLEPMHLPGFWGSSFRGLFGHALRQSHCVTGTPSCRGCPVAERCTYHWLFETPIGDRPALLGKSDYAPHPFVLHVPPPARPQRIEQGRQLSFGMTLFGRASAYLPAIIPVVERMGSLGIGDTRARFTLESVERAWLPDSPFWTPVPINGSRVERGHPFRPPSAPKAVRVNLETPLRLVASGRPIDPEHFTTRAFFTSVMRRVSLLAWYHEDQQHQADYKDLATRAAALTASQVDLRNHRWQRWSARQNRRLTMDGLMGSFTLSGRDLAALWPWLWLASYTHTGKGTGFGLGRFTLRPAAAPP
jgi:hypothetical protein